MRRIAPLVLIALILTVGLPALCSVPSGDAIVAGLKRAFAAVNDYRADVSLTMKGPNMSINDMGMTVYFKKPGKIHVDAAQGMAVVPSGSFGNPMDEFTSAAHPVYIKAEKKLGVDCHLLKLTNSGPQAGDILIWVDTKRPVLVAMEAQRGGGTMKSAWRYEKIDGKYYLPVQINVDTSAPVGPNAGKPVKLTIKFANYRVNKGISDKVFTQDTSKPMPTRHWRRH
jgi:hypothetical protein